MWYIAEYFCELGRVVTSFTNRVRGSHRKAGNLMLTTDLALIKDPIYCQIVAEFANDINVLNTAFGAVWEKLTTSGGGFAEGKFCVDASELIYYNV